jgi:hypothetical protein
MSMWATAVLTSRFHNEIDLGRPPWFWGKTKSNAPAGHRFGRNVGKARLTISRTVFLLSPSR